VLLVGIVITRDREKRESAEMRSRIVRAFVVLLVFVFVFALWSSAVAAPVMTPQASHCGIQQSATAAANVGSADYARLGNLTPAEAAVLGNIAPARVNLPSADYARLGNLTPAEAAVLGNIALATVTFPSADYARLGSLTPAEAAVISNIAPATC
jgi:hypothetical protein